MKMEDRVKVKVANEELLCSEGKCHESRFRMQGNDFFKEVHVLVLADCDMVLRVQWLRELGPIL